MGDKDKSWDTNIAGKTCLERVRQWNSGTRKALRFASPLTYRESKNLYDKCYFSSVFFPAMNQKKRRSIDQPSLHAAIRPVPHSNYFLIPIFQENMLKLV